MKAEQDSESVLSELSKCCVQSNPSIGVPLAVGQEHISWKEGRAMVFDDSFEHEAWNNGSTARAVRGVPPDSHRWQH